MCFIHKAWYSALPISRGHLSPNNSRKTPIAHPLGRGVDVLREFQVWPNLYHRSCCAVSMQYCAILCRNRSGVYSAKSLPTYLSHRADQCIPRHMCSCKLPPRVRPHRWRCSDTGGQHTHQCLIGKHGSALSTFIKLGNFFNVFLFSNNDPCNFYIFVWNWSNAMNIWSPLWMLMTWCFSTRVSTRASVTTLLRTCLYVSSLLVYLWVKWDVKYMRKHSNRSKAVILERLKHIS